MANEQRSAAKAKLGRLAKLTWAGATLYGLQEKGITVNGEAIDVTSDEDGGWRTKIAERGTRSVDISISGVDKNGVFRRAALSTSDADAQAAAVLTWDGGATITGTFILEGYTEGMPIDGAVTFQATLQSTGPVVFAAGG